MIAPALALFAFLKLNLYLNKTFLDHYCLKWVEFLHVDFLSIHLYFHEISLSLYKPQISRENEDVWNWYTRNSFNPLYGIVEIVCRTFFFILPTAFPPKEEDTCITYYVAWWPTEMLIGSVRRSRRLVLWRAHTAAGNLMLRKVQNKALYVYRKVESSSWRDTI